MKKETFSPTIGYTRLYKTSSFGRIWSCRLHRFLNPKPTKFGYIRVDLTDRFGIEKSIALHRLVGLSFIPNPENKPFINHKNGIKTDNRVKNLQWCTTEENNIHAIALGLRIGVRGEKSNWCKLTTKKVLEIRSLYPKIKSYKRLAIMYSTTFGNIYHIIKRNTWAHV